MLISICIPTYNRPKNLINCLNSLALQTNKNFEVCLSDNCSKENIGKLIKPFQKKLKIRFNKNKKNLGFALNLLKVSSIAKGDFIWFLGDDDLLVPKAIEKLTNNIKVFCAAFINSKAYVCSRPLSISLHGVREWGGLYEFVEIVRIPEALDYYRSIGLSYFKYLRIKNYALRNFFNYFAKIIINGEKAGLKYVNFRKHFVMNLVYPNAWLSIIYFIFRKIKIIFKI